MIQDGNKIKHKTKQKIESDATGVRAHHYLNLVRIMHVLQSCNLNLTLGQGTGKCVRYNEVSLYRSSFPYVLLLVG